MTSETTKPMIDAARTVAAALKPIPGVKSSWVDDWGRFGNFRLFVTVNNLPTVNLRLVRSALKEALKPYASKGAHLRSVVMPRRRYRRVGRYRIFDGWDSDGRQFADHGEIAIDLDFYRYSPATNSFPAVQPNGALVLG